ncbi:MAG TPA: hypothetical protein ENJ45_02190 [Phaeodactylibacter sp.]|nr:hypothetical protein [Phaeodactylibacter sp.]
MTRTQNGSPLMAILLLLIIWGIHSYREDTDFLRLLHIAPRRIFMVEYSLLILPFSMLALWLTGDVYMPIIMQLGALLIAALPTGLYALLRTKKGRDLAWIPTELFELKTTFRKNYLSIALLYILALTSAMFTISMPLALIAFLMLASSAYESIENRELIEASFQRNKSILSKIKKNLLAFHLFLIPLYILFLLFHLHYWYILLALIVFASGVLTFAISYKYAHYYPGRQRANNTLAITFFFLFFANPFFAPVALVYLWVYFRRAKRRLDCFV